MDYKINVKEIRQINWSCFKFAVTIVTDSYLSAEKMNYIRETIEKWFGEYPITYSVWDNKCVFLCVNR